MKTLYTMYTNFAKRLAVVLVLLLTFGVTSVWGAEKTATLNSTCFKSNANNYQETEGTIEDTSGGEWKVKGYGMVQNTSVTLGKGNANYLQTPNFSGNISKIKVTCSGSYYLQITDNNGNVVCEQQKVSNSPLTFNISGDYTQLKLFTKRFESTSNAATTITEVVVTYNTTPACEYTVQFNSNGGTGTMSDQTFTCDVAQELTANSFSRTGYTFVGWNTEADGLGDSYINQESVNLSSINNDNITLYAQWQINSYTVTWKPNGGNWSGNASDKVEDYNYGATITTPSNPTRYGYNFTGWNPTPATTMPASDQIYTAQWTEKALINYRTTCSTETTVSVIPKIMNFWQSIFGVSLGYLWGKTGYRHVPGGIVVVSLHHRCTKIDFHHINMSKITFAAEPLFRLKVRGERLKARTSSLRSKPVIYFREQGSSQ